MQTTGKTPNLAAGPESRVIHFNDMPARTMANGSESRNVLQGKTGTGDAVSVHITTQPKGAQANPAHAIQHTEFFCVEEGVLEIEHDGRVDRVEPGDVMLIAKGTVHQVRNAGEGPVRYFVVAIGGDVAPGVKA
jgi:mannose-6-phosphate isomerase-like protein (cupin superfamily)